MEYVKIIPQKIQDTAPELSSRSHIKPMGKIPSSADILRDYVPKDNMQNVVSELPSSQMREKISELAVAENGEGESFSDMIETLANHQEEGASVTSRDNAILNEAKTEETVSTEPQMSMTDRELTVDTNQDVLQQSLSNVSPVADIQNTPQIEERNVMVEPQPSVESQEVREEILQIQTSENLSINPDIAHSKDEVSNENQPIITTNVTEDIADASVSSSENLADVVPMQAMSANIPETAGDNTLLQVNNENTVSYPNNDDISAPQVAEVQAAVQTLDELPKFEEWESNDDEDTSAQSSRKININNILNINSKEVDKHFEHIKQIAASAMKKAEEQASAIKKKVEDADLVNSPSVHKIKALAQKIKLFRKK